MPRIFFLLAAAVLAPAAIGGKVIHVLDAQDGKGFNTCPGDLCNLRAAWEVLEVNDTIVLDVDPIMGLGPLTFPTWTYSKTNGTVTIRGGGNDRAKITGDDRFLSIDNYPYSQVYVQLVFRDVEFSGFRYAPPDLKSTLPGLVFCLSSANHHCTSQQFDDRNTAGSRLKTRAALPRPRAETEPGLVGRTQTPFGNFSTLAERAMLVLQNCMFHNNTYTAPPDAYDGSLIYTYTEITSESRSVAQPIFISNSQFLNNSVKGQVSGGSIITGEGLTNAVIIKDSRFEGNLMESTGSAGTLLDSFQGPLIGTFGPIGVSGSSFVGNTMGPCQSFFSSGSTDSDNYHTYIANSTFLDNGGNGMPANDVAGAINSGWIVLEKVTARLPSTVVPTFTQGTQDQYMDGCSIKSETGKPVSLNGYQMYNRNPLDTNLVNGTYPGPGGVGLGFADCAQGAAFLPCPKGTQCTTLHNNGVTIGYSCNA